LPAFMGVVVSSTIVNLPNGDSSAPAANPSGNVPRIVVVKTNDGYGPDPGMIGTGIVVATYCK
jgi:hypothetical protein